MTLRPAGQSVAAPANSTATFLGALLLISVPVAMLWFTTKK